MHHQSILVHCRWLSSSSTVRACHRHVDHAMVFIYSLYIYVNVYIYPSLCKHIHISIKCRAAHVARMQRTRMVVLNSKKPPELTRLWYLSHPANPDSPDWESNPYDKSQSVRYAILHLLYRISLCCTFMFNINEGTISYNHSVRFPVLNNWFHMMFVTDTVSRSIFCRSASWRQLVLIVTFTML